VGVITVERRNLVGGGVLAGAAALLGVAEPTAVAADDSEAAARAIENLRAALERHFAVSPELSRIREQQRIFLKANQKFPDFIEVSIDVWENIYDWHVRHQQPIQASRTADGRYVMTVMFTTLILRPEQVNGYVGYGFDAR
jgi:MinD-like ATPase involved in chromosome partitioning or flagellar assembly